MLKKQTQLSELERELAQARQSSSAAVDTLKADLASRDAELAKLTTSKQELTAQLSELQSKCDNIEGKLKSKDAECVSALKASEVKDARLEELGGKCAGLAERLSELAVEKESCQRSAAEELSGLQQTLDDTSKKAAQVRQHMRCSVRLRHESMFCFFVLIVCMRL